MLFKEEMNTFMLAKEKELKEKMMNDFKNCDKCLAAINEIKKHCNKVSIGSYVSTSKQSSIIEMLAHTNSRELLNAPPVYAEAYICSDCGNTVSVSENQAKSEYLYGFDESIGYEEISSKINHFLSFSAKKELDNYLEKTFSNRNDTVTLYIEASKDLSRSEQYTRDIHKMYHDKTQIDEAINFYYAYISEKEAMLSLSHSYHEECFIMKIEYPLNKIRFSFVDYGDCIDVVIDKRFIQNITAFDVYTKSFMPLNQFDEDIHFYKRNIDTIQFLEENRRVANLDEYDEYNEINAFIDQFTGKTKKEILQKLFPIEQAQKEKDELENEKVLRAVDNTFENWVSTSELPTRLLEEDTQTFSPIFEEGDMVIVTSGEHRGKKACVFHDESPTKEFVHVLWFGATDTSSSVELPKTVLKKI